MARPRSEKSRQAVLAAMRAALAEHGYDAVTIEGLAQVAEVSKQTIYRWWPSKAAILGEALREGDSPLAAEIPVTDDLESDLAAWLRTGAETAATDEGVAVARALIAVTATDPELGAELNTRLASPIIEAFATRLAIAKANGTVRADVDDRALADLFVAIGAYQSLLARPLDEARIQALLDLLLRGLLNTES